MTKVDLSVQPILSYFRNEIYQNQKLFHCVLLEMCNLEVKLNKMHAKRTGSFETKVWCSNARRT